MAANVLDFPATYAVVGINPNQWIAPSAIGRLEPVGQMYYIPGLPPSGACLTRWWTETRIAARPGGDDTRTGPQTHSGGSGSRIYGLIRAFKWTAIRCPLKSLENITIMYP